MRHFRARICPRPLRRVRPDFLIAYSCKGRGVCPACNTRRMVETAAHLADHVIARLPIRQWVLSPKRISFGASLPKRLRYYLQSDPAILVPAELQMRLLIIEILLDMVQDVVADLVVLPDAYQFLALGLYGGVPQAAGESDTRFLFRRVHRRALVLF